MAWVAVATAVVGAGASYYSAQQQKKHAEQQAKLANQALQTPTVTTREPWGPSSQYRQDLMARAMALLGGQGYSSPQSVPGIGGSQAGPTAAPMTRGERYRAAHGGMTRQEYQASLREGGPSGPSGTADEEGGGRWRGKGGGGGGGTGGGGGGGGKGGMRGVYDDYARRVLGEYYLNEGSNPYLNDMVAAMRRNSEGQFGQADMAAEQAGRMGGGAHQVFNAALARGVNEAELGMRYQNYGDERDRMTQTYGIGTGYDAQLRSIAQQMAAARLAASTQRYGIDAQSRAAAASNEVARGYLSNARQMMPYQQLGSVTDIINAMSGPYGTTTQQGSQQFVQTPYFDQWGAALQGGKGAWSLANQYQGQRPATGRV